MLRLAVVGHVEWVTFARVERVPVAGEIVRAGDAWEEAAGGGGVVAVQLARLNGSCEFFTACEPAAERRLRDLRVTVHAARRPTRRVFTHLSADGERTITLLDPRVKPHRDDQLPWERLAECDAVYFTAGDAAAARAARAARVLVATPRAYDALGEVEVDVLVGSGGDVDEVAWAADLRARWTVWTEGALGGRWSGADGTSGRWSPQRLPGSIVDAYGCGDSFAAGVTLVLGMGRTLEESLGFGARCGGACLTGRGPYGADLPGP